LAFGPDLTFLVDVPNGSYDVTLTVGETGPHPHEQVALYLEGTQRATLSTAVAEVKTLTYHVAVNDGQFTLRLQAVGASDPNAALNGLKVVWAGPDAVGPQVVSAAPTVEVVGMTDHVTLTFDEPLEDGSFTLADVVSLTGPGGAITPTAVTRLSDTTYQVCFPAQTA